MLASNLTITDNELGGEPLGAAREKDLVVVVAVGVDGEMGAMAMQIGPCE